MSGIFRKGDYTEEDAFQLFIKNSDCSILSKESSHSIVLLLTYRAAAAPAAAASGGAGGGGGGGGAAAVASPYSRIYFSAAENTIKQEDVLQLVLKLVPIDLSLRATAASTQIRFIDSGKEEERESLPDKYISSFKEWSSEILFQKLAFFSSFMVDYQMQAITPNILLSFLINSSKLEEFNRALNFNEEHIPIYSLFMRKILVTDDRRVGCILMEYLDQAVPFKDYKCLIPSITLTPKIKAGKVLGGSFDRRIDCGTEEQRKAFMNAKSYVLIEIDKCASIGINHNDYHTGNVVSYINPEGVPCGAILDFGKASLFKDTTCDGKRVRPFDTLENKGSVYAPFTGGRLFIKANNNNYLSDCVLWHNSSIEDSDMGGEIRIIMQWADPKAKDSKGEYIHVPMMNTIDNEMVSRGIAIRAFLLKETMKGGDPMAAHIAKNSSNIRLQYTKNNKTGAVSLLETYLLAKGLNTCCESILARGIVKCISLFDDSSVSYPPVVLHAAAANGKVVLNIGSAAAANGKVVLHIAPEAEAAASGGAGVPSKSVAPAAAAAAAAAVASSEHLFAGYIGGARKTRKARLLKKKQNRTKSIKRMRRYTM